MNYTHLTSLKVFLIFFLVYALPACASSPKVPLVHETVQSQVMIRQRDTESFSERKPLDVITVVASRKLSGDILILRWNLDRNKFEAEVYRQEDKPGRRAWLFRKDNKSKTLNQQPNREFFISEIIEGKDGGQLVEVFRLSTPDFNPVTNSPPI